MKLRIFYIVSLIILGVLSIVAIKYTATSSSIYGEVVREQLLETDDEWIIQLDITNRENRDASYIINTEVGGQTLFDSVTLKSGKMYSYIYHIYKNLNRDEATLTLFKDGGQSPSEQVTYHFKGQK